MAHTPTPWETGYDGCSVYGPDRDFGAGTTTHVVVRCRAGGVKTVENRANAEFIVRAVNNHDRLIEALEECITENGAFAFASEDFYRAKQRLMAISNIARAALAAARGEE